MRAGNYYRVQYSSNPDDYDIILLCSECFSKRPDKLECCGSPEACGECCYSCHQIITS